MGPEKLAGWQVADHVHTELAEDALRAAARERRSPSNAVFHTDHGSIYTSKPYVTLCKDLEVTQSMGGIGTSADNSVTECFNAALKRKLLTGRTAFPDQATASHGVFRWANRYTTRRRHSALGNISTNAYEAARSAPLCRSLNSSPSIAITLTFHIRDSTQTQNLKFL